MIVGGYALDLYCENATEPFDSVHPYQEFPHSYQHEYGCSARKRARRDGWRLNLIKGTAICPECTKKEDSE